MMLCSKSDDVFFKNAPIDKEKTFQLLQKAAIGCDDTDLFFQENISERFVLDDGRIKSAELNARKGFGLRAVLGDSFAFAHATNISQTALEKALENVLPIKTAPQTSSFIFPIENATRHLYSAINPPNSFSCAQKTALLEKIDAYVRSKDPQAVQVTASLASEFDCIKIMRPDRFEVEDFRPLVHLSIRVVLEHNGRRETGSFGFGGRYAYDRLFDETAWKHAADKAMEQARINLSAVLAPVGEMPVVLSNGWCGVLLHEAVGHGLEGDFIRKKTSVFSDKKGQQVAAKGITIIDDGSIPERRGSLNIDDEGTPTQPTVLIEDGILKGFMQDRMNARLMETLPTGNARRESFACPPQVRMTNTFMQSGSHTLEEMIASVKKGIYAVSFSGGQVDIVSGSFVFGASEAYKIENGKITAPVKNAMLIGSGIDVMNAIDMVGNDSCLDNGIGSCGKGGQSVPVGVGQPSVRIKNITVGGSETA